MEKLIAITASLPPNSKSRKRLSHTIVRTLWDSLDHPPRSYLGEKFQYRMADGSYNVSYIQPLTQRFCFANLILTRTVVLRTFSYLILAKLGRHMQGPPEQLRGFMEFGLILDCYSIVRILTTMNSQREKLISLAVLMSRDDKSFKENPAGISSVLFYHATIIVHGKASPWQLEENSTNFIQIFSGRIEKTQTFLIPHLILTSLRFMDLPWKTN